MCFTLVLLFFLPHVKKYICTFYELHHAKQAIIPTRHHLVRSTFNSWYHKIWWWPYAERVKVMWSKRNWQEQQLSFYWQVASQKKMQYMRVRSIEKWYKREHIFVNRIHRFFSFSLSMPRLFKQSKCISTLNITFINANPPYQAADRIVSLTQKQLSLAFFVIDRHAIWYDHDIQQNPHIFSSGYNRKNRAQ